MNEGLANVRYLYNHQSDGHQKLFGFINGGFSNMRRIMEEEIMGYLKGP